MKLKIKRWRKQLGFEGEEVVEFDYALDDDRSLEIEKFSTTGLGQPCFCEADGALLDDLVRHRWDRHLPLHAARCCPLGGDLGG